MELRKQHFMDVETQSKVTKLLTESQDLLESDLESSWPC